MRHGQRLRTRFLRGLLQVTRFDAPGVDGVVGMVMGDASNLRDGVTDWRVHQGSPSSCCSAVSGQASTAAVVSFGRTVTTPTAPVARAVSAACNEPNRLPRSRRIGKLRDPSLVHHVSPFVRADFRSALDQVAAVATLISHSRGFCRWLVERRESIRCLPDSTFLATLPSRRRVSRAAPGSTTIRSAPRFSAAAMISPPDARLASRSQRRGRSRGVSLPRSWRFVGAGPWTRGAPLRKRPPPGRTWSGPSPWSGIRRPRRH